MCISDQTVLLMITEPLVQSSRLIKKIIVDQTSSQPAQTWPLYLLLLTEQTYHRGPGLKRFAQIVKYQGESLLMHN